jgi:Na+-transporting methylmalonyl-CoA/oxaloacetate decarboxylase gamma subunit
MRRVFPANTYFARPLGPLSGLGAYPMRRRRMAINSGARASLRGMGALGMTMPFAGSLQPQVNQISQQMAQAQAQIDANNQNIVTLNQQGVDVSAEAAQNLQAQNQLSTAVDDFTTFYRAVYGTVPPGLSGMGQFDPASLSTIAGAAVALSVIAGLVAAVWQICQTVQASIAVKMQNAQTAGQAANNVAYAQQQLAAAQAAGDSAAEAQWQAALSDAYSAQQGANAANQPPPPSWISQNWIWVAGGAAVLLVATKL